MIEQLEEDAAPARRAAGRKLTHYAVLRNARKILNAPGQKNLDRLRIEFAQQTDHLRGFRDWPATHSAAQILQAFLAQIGGEVGDVFSIVA